ncbi:MAG: hypothetical protein U5K00_06015 [Melioribacteraceae bacterium]|nr:hypothetical protein [Melioribacteraceae bacterium]
MAEPINLANALITISENGKNEYILLLEGKLFIKDYPLDPKQTFEQSLEDYFETTIPLVKNAEEKDLDRIKILLNWMSNNIEKTKTYYLKNYNNITELYTDINSN